MAYIVRIRNKQGELLYRSHRLKTYEDARAIAKARMDGSLYPDAQAAIITDATTGVYVGSISIVGEDKV